MRLRSLRKLEEFEIRTEDKNLRGELKGIKALLGSEAEQWSKVGEQVRKVRDMFGPKTPLGKRRTQFADAPEHDLAAIEEAFVEREPVTVVVSDKGWVRTLKGHVEDLSGLDLQDRRQSRFCVLRRDHLKTAAVRHQRQILFARCRQTAGRPRPWRADPDVHRHGAGRRDRLDVRQQGRPQIPDRQRRRARALSSTRTIASAIPARASRCSTSRCRTRPARSRPSPATWSR